MITDSDLTRWFMYQAPSLEQTAKYEAIRNAAKEFASIVLASTPPSEDQTVAIRKILEAVMIANSSIACEGQ